MKAPATQVMTRFWQAKKNPLVSGFYRIERLSAGVHAPPKDMTEDDDLLFLDFLEAVVLVRMFVAVEAAQANPGRQAIQLFHPKLSVVIDCIKVAVNDIANPALAGIDPDRRSVTQYRQHAVAPHCHALSLIELNAVMAQATFAEAQARALAFFDDESSRSCGQFNLAKKGDRHLVVIDRGIVVPQAYILEFRMHRSAPGIGGRRDVRATSQLIGAHGEVLGDLRNMFIRRIDDLPAENARERGLRHAGTTVKLRGGDPVLVEQCS